MAVLGTCQGQLPTAFAVHPNSSLNLHLDLGCLECHILLLSNARQATLSTVFAVKVVFGVAAF